MDFIEISKKIGKKAILISGGLNIEVTVINHKMAYGQDRWEVRPIAGSMTIWVETPRLFFAEDTGENLYEPTN